MTITIDVDDITKCRLELEANLAGKPLPEYVSELVSKTGDARSATGSRRRRNLGFGKGWITMSEDFDAPMEEFREYM